MNSSLKRISRYYALMLTTIVVLLCLNMKVFITAVLTLLFAFSAFAQAQGEVTAPRTFLRKSPSPAGKIIQPVLQGDKFLIKEMQDKDGWYYVSVSNDKIKGWINKNAIRLLENEKTVKPTPQTAASIPTTSTAPTAKPMLTPSPTPAPAGEQAPVEDNEVLRVETEEVSLNVRVVNSNNRPVNNLNKSQFEVYEDDMLQPITSFVTTEVPMINALVIDNSRSLRSQLGKVIEAGKIITGANRPKDESAIIRFVSTDKIEVVQDFTTNKGSINNALDNLFVEGGQTAIIDAVYQTAKKVEQYQNSRKTEDVKLRALILVSDGDDRGSSHNEQQLFELLRASNVQIYAVGFVSNLNKEPDANGINRQEKARDFLTRLSQETGGKVYFPGSIDELSQIASDISGELRTQYLVSYSPTNENRDGTFRKIKVVITEGADKEKRTAITRAGRTSAPK